jgi:uncharacterized protein
MVYSASFSAIFAADQFMNAFDPARVPYVSLTTYRKTGAAVSTPVWIAELDGLYYVFSAASAGKVKRLHNNDQVSLAVCNYSGKLAAGAVLQGSARIVTDPDLIKGVYGRFVAKYGWQFRLTNLLSRLAGRINQRAMIEIAIPA